MDTETLLEWAYHYLDHRAKVYRRIKSIEKQKDKIVMKLKSGEEAIGIPAVRLDIKIPDKPTTLFVPNTKNNLKKLLEKWDEFAENRDLKLVFVNPDSTQEMNWVIKPYIHSKITEKKNLKKGLTSMFETVDPVRLCPK